MRKVPQKNFFSTKGVSLPLVIGLVTLLMVSSMAANELIIRNLRSVQRIESSNRAFMAAEAGIEDALYELSPHFAGYQTPTMGNSEMRNGFLDDNDQPCNAGLGGHWCEEWWIESHSQTDKWGGKLYPGQKIVLPLYNDTHSKAVAPNAVNDVTDGSFTEADIMAVPINGPFEITFSIPDPERIFTGGESLAIDNDGDGRVNEDGKGVAEGAVCTQNPEDDDCDGQVNEDSGKNPIILWRLADGLGKTLIPILGCVEDVGDEQGSEPCEDDFGSSDNYSAALNQDAVGKNERGENETIGEFLTRSINPPDGSPNAKIQMEILIVATMEHTDRFTNKRTIIPFLDYTVSTPGVSNLPYPFFTIKSDGYYRNFKQSITATVTPKTTVPLFDFTIIQQE